MNRLSKYTLIFAICIFLILSTVLVSADVNSFGLEYNYLPITRISLSNPLTVTVVFNIDTEFQPYKLVANFSDLVQNPYYKQNYQEIVIGGNSCNYDNETLNYKCGLSNVIINPETANVNLNFEVFYTPYNSSQYPISHTFDIDNDSPALTDIRTDYCYEDKCYIKSGSNKIYFDFDDSSENFVRRKVFYSMENNRYPVSYCLSGECYSAMTKICTSGQSYQIELVTSGNYKSEDDAGNPIIANDLTRNIYCDSIKPFQNLLGDNNFYELSTGEEVDGSNIEFIGDSSTYGLISGGKPLMIKAYVFEDGPIVYAQANLSSIGGSNEEVSCIKQENIPNLHICEFSVAALLNEHLQQTINFKFTDIVNNSFTTSKEITILHSPGTDVATPNCVEVEVENFYPKKINRIALDLSQTNSLSYPTYAPYTPKRKSGSFCSGAEISEQKIEDCWITTSNGSLMPALGNYFDDSSNINHPYWKLDENNFIDLPISVDPNAIDSTKLICNLSFNLYDNRNIYSEPIIKTVEWDVTLINSKLGRPGESYVAKLKESSKKLDEKWKVIEVLNDGVATASKLCQAGNFLKDTLNNLQVSLDVLQFGIGMFNEQSKNQPLMSNALKVTLANMDSGDFKALKKNATGVISNIFEMACWASSCSYANYLESTSMEDGNLFQEASKAYNGAGTPLTDIYPDAEIGDFDSVGEKLGKDLLGNIGTPDLYNSVFACASTGCIPGVIYHANKWRESECDYLYCLKRQAQYGLSIDACEVSKKTYTCKFIVGEFFEMPFVREAKNLADNFNDLAQNFVPKILFDVVSSATCTEDYERVVSNPKAKVGDLNMLNIIGCEIPLSIGRAIRNKKMTNKLGSFQYPTPDVDICKLAMCNEEDQNDCEIESGMTWFNNLMPPEIKAVVNSQDLSSFEQMEMLQANNRAGINNKYYGSAISHYNEVVERCRKNNGCSDKDTKKLYDSSRKLKYSYGTELPDNYDEVKEWVGTETNANKQKEIIAKEVSESISKSYFSENYEEVSGVTIIVDPDDLIQEPTRPMSDEDIQGTETLYDYLKLKEKADDEELLDTDSINSRVMRNLNTEAQERKEEFYYAKNHVAKQEETKELISLGVTYYAQEKEQKAYLIDNPPKFAEEIFTKNHGVFDQERWEDYLKDPDNYILYEVEYGDGQKEYLTKEELDNLPLVVVVKETKEVKINDKVSEEVKKQKQQIESHKQEIVKYRNERQEKINFMQRRNRMKKWVDIAVKWFWNRIVKDFGTLGDIGERLDSEGLIQLSEILNNNLNSEAWKNSLCNPQAAGLFSDFEADEGSAIDCTGTTCRTVLTMAMERTAYNWSDESHETPDNYLYTFVYHMGPIKNINEYNIYFEYNKYEEHCVFKDENDNCKDKDLSIGDIQSKSIAFISNNYYEEVRFEFKHKFPGPSTTSYEVGRVFTRKITESQFDTGQPDRDFEIADLGSGDSSSSLNEVYN